MFGKAGPYPGISLRQSRQIVIWAMLWSRPLFSQLIASFYVVGTVAFGSVAPGERRAGKQLRAMLFAVFPTPTKKWTISKLATASIDIDWQLAIESLVLRYPA
jgi:hypothetical protein